MRHYYTAITPIIMMKSNAGAIPNAGRNVKQKKLLFIVYGNTTQLCSHVGRQFSSF